MSLLRFRSVILFLFILSLNYMLAQFDPHAGIIPSYTQGANVSVSSITPSAIAENIIDGDEGSFWQSGGALPSGFLVRPDLNILLGLGGTSSSTNSGGLFDVEITDGDVYTGLQIPPVSGKAWVELDLGGTSPFRSLSFKGSVVADSITIWIYHDLGDSLKIGTYNEVDNYSMRRFSLVDTITKIRLESSSQFTITDVGALAEVPTEYAVIDLGIIQNIGVLETRHFTANSVTKSEVYLSSDSITWNKVFDLNPLALTLVSNYLPTEIPARYIMLKHTMLEENWNKANIWEIRAYDKYGKYGPFPSPSSNSHTMSDMFGVNGIWGWGHGMYSDLLSPGEGAFKYNQICSHARNYHNMNWDVSDPDITPDYSAMPGSLSQWWLDWDREYEVWNSAGMGVFASIQFSNVTQPENIWDNPYQAAYNYGFAFAEHFGPGVGNGLVQRIEIGNEPWDYQASFYREILQGMAEGAKAADPDLLVFPCALQAADSSAEMGNYMNYAGARLLDTLVPYIDGLNVHHYSYYNDSAGERRATYPENYTSSMRGILNDLRYRDANFPEKKIFVSEWGWDSDGAGESCFHNECVSEEAQAIYGVRAAMMLNRLGVDDMTWFFYANANSGSSLYTRSGLTGSSATSFLEKKSFIAFDALLHHIGNKYFLDTLIENDNHWVYLFGDSTGTPTYLAGWRPVDESDNNVSIASFPITFAPDSAWNISGLSNTGTIAPLPTYSGGNMSLALTGVPLLVKLQSPTVDSAPNTLKKKIAVFPNPTDGDVSIIGDLSNLGHVMLRNCFGENIRTWEKGVQSINVSDLSPGIYYLYFQGSPIIIQLVKVN